MKKRRYEALELDELAALIASGDEGARDEVRRRFLALAVWFAARYCSALYHRNGRCPRWACDEGPFALGVHVVLERFAGSEGKVSLVERWQKRVNRALTFETFARSNAGGWQTEVLRAWNMARGLPCRWRLSADMKASAGDLYARMLAARPEVAAAAGRLGLDRPGDVAAWLEAMWTDACQAGLDAPIDVRRVGRFALGRDVEISQADEEDVSVCADAVDELVFWCWPDWYSSYLSRPRQHTRVPRQIAPDDLLGEDAGAREGEG